MLSCYTPQLDGHTNGFQTSLKSNSIKSFVLAVANLSIPWCLNVSARRASIIRLNPEVVVPAHSHKLVDTEGS